MQYMLFCKVMSLFIELRFCAARLDTFGFSLKRREEKKCNPARPFWLLHDCVGMRIALNSLQIKIYGIQKEIMIHSELRERTMHTKTILKNFDY